MRDHPRSRGENIVAAQSSGDFKGSSPLTRGKQATEIGFQHLEGIIPAHAGKTEPVGGVKVRVCGSSPLTRGKQCASRNGYFPAGIIPAHAGKTYPRAVE